MGLPVNRDIASALSRLFAEGQGPTHTELTSIFRAAGYQDADPFDPPTVRCNKHTRVLAVLRAAQHRPAYATQLVTDLLRALHLSGHLVDRSSAPLTALRTAFERTGWNLTPSGNLERL